MAHRKEVAVGWYWVYFSPIEKFVLVHPVLKLRAIFKYPLGQPCILDRIASHLQTNIIFFYTLYNRIFRSALVANTVGLKYEWLAGSSVKTLTFFFLFFFLFSIKVCSL